MVNWIRVNFLLVLSELIVLESKSIDFVLAFTQAELDVPIYMDLPIGIEVTGSGGKRKEHALILKKNINGLNQASTNCYKY